MFNDYKDLFILYFLILHYEFSFFLSSFNITAIFWSVSYFELYFGQMAQIDWVLMMSMVAQC